MKYLGLVLSGLKRKKLRTVLTVLSIFVAFLLFGFLVTIKKSFEMGVDVAGADRLFVRHKISLIQFLPVAYEAKMEAIDGVSEATHATWFGGIYQRPLNMFPQFPVKPEEYLQMFPEFLLSEQERKAWLSTRTGVVVGRNTADRFGWQVGDRIPIQATIWRQKDGSTTWEFDLVGIYEGADKQTDTTQFLFRYDYFDEARIFGQGSVGWYHIRVDDPARAAEIAEAVDREFANSPSETKTEAEGAFFQSFANQVGNIGLILIFVMSAVFFTILLIAGNTMAQSVRERIEELALFKAMGFTHRRVLLLVLAESCLVALLGGLAGLGVAWLLILRGDPTNGLFPVFYLPTSAVAIGILLALAVGLSAGALPAIRAMRLRIADGLRR